MIKVMIVDDQELIRHSLKIILGVNNDMEVVGMAADGAETLQKLKELSPEERPDVILMDIRMPVMDGVECTAQISKKYPNIKVIALTTFDDEEFVFGALKSGASGYLLKGSSLEELSGAIRTVYTGGAMLNPNVASTVIRQFSTMAKNAMPSAFAVILSSKTHAIGMPWFQTFFTIDKVVEIEFLIFSAAARITITSRYRVTILQIRLYNPVGSFCKVLSKEAENTSELR